MLRHLRADRRRRVSIILKISNFKQIRRWKKFIKVLSQKLNYVRLAILLQERAAARDGEDGDPREETDSVSEEEDDEGIYQQ